MVPTLEGERRRVQHCRAWCNPIVLGIIFLAVAAKKTLEQEHGRADDDRRGDALPCDPTDHPEPDEDEAEDEEPHAHAERGPSAVGQRLRRPRDDADALLLLTLPVAALIVALAVEAFRLREMRSRLRAS